MNWQGNQSEKRNEELLACRHAVSDQQNQLIRFGQTELLACQPFDGYRRSFERPDFLEKLLGFGLECRDFLLQGLKLLVGLKKLDEAAVAKQCVDKG